jgi:hypothetical protein
MGVTKIYQAIEFKSLDTYEMVNGVKTLIEFRNASQSPTAKGHYTTSNPAIIAAMDNSTSYGITFKCIHSEPTDDPEPLPKAVAKKPAPKPAPTEAPETSEDETPEGEDETHAEGEVTKVPGITTIQAARAYLVENFGLSVSKLPNGPSVKKAAAENKVNFIDLQ